MKFGIRSSTVGGALLTLLMTGMFVVTGCSDPVSVSESAAGENDKPDVPSDLPFEIPEEGPYAKVEVEELEHNFDRMLLGESGNHVFLFKNVGEAPLKLAKGRTQCKCTLSDLARNEIPPGEVGEVELTWTPVSAASEFTKQAQILTNDPDQPIVTLTITGGVFERVVVEPGKTWTLGVIPENDTARFDGLIFSQLDDDMEIESVETSNDALTITYEKLSDEQLERVDGLSGFRILGELEPRVDIGRFTETFSIKTNLEDVEPLDLSVTGNRIGPFSIVGPNWYAGRTLIDLGKAESDKGKKSTLSIFISPFGETLKFFDIETDPEFLKVSLNKDENFQSESRERYILTIEVPPGAQSGAWRMPDAGTIRVKSNHPEVPSFEFNVELSLE
ncbi:hypothetical protein Mal4_37810 [Maioricimonas rarisocia]|uniref:DUF1573 domain-containing protein n=1 Tax=Maioricimonas rarisocia TaxID=2528026 RepID=A0A517ZAC6_9PLAN|nr:DUF1573 domain-containing protein [Maioricimonas rarisocia]QDU39436.1 hypothetical protein Mal4_37810 [Maioricimonas rarisocia]